MEYKNGLTEVVWTDSGVATGVVPDTDSEIKVDDCDLIAIQIDTTHASNTATDIDINVLSSVDGSIWDTASFAEERGIGDGVIITVLIHVGVEKIKLRLDNNASATTGFVTARVYLRRR